MDINLFLCIIGLGIAIPFTGVILLNIVIKLVEASYQLDINKITKLYLMALGGWALFISTIL